MSKLNFALRNSDYQKLGSAASPLGWALNRDDFVKFAGPMYMGQPISPAIGLNAPKNVNEAKALLRFNPHSVYASAAASMIPPNEASTFSRTISGPQAKAMINNQQQLRQSRPAVQPPAQVNTPAPAPATPSSLNQPNQRMSTWNGLKADARRLGGGINRLGGGLRTAFRPGGGGRAAALMLGAGALGAGAMWAGNKLFGRGGGNGQPVNGQPVNGQPVNGQPVNGQIGNSDQDNDPYSGLGPARAAMNRAADKLRPR